MATNQNQNQYDLNIDNTRNQNGQTGININQNPYLNQNVNQTTQQTVPTNNTTTQNGFFNGDFVKGALIGAAVTYLLTNKNAQETIFKVFGKGSELFSAGMEELKERYEDAKAQIQTQQEQ